eukprot:8394595-Pyramimonas_sp.AAC.1
MDPPLLAIAFVDCGCKLLFVASCGLYWWWTYLEPGHVAGGLEELGGDAAEGAEHGPASVDQLSLSR